MIFTTVLFAFGLVGSVAAQTASGTATDSGMVSSTTTGIPEDATAYPIDLTPFNDTIKTRWCDNQQDSCFSLCTPNGGPSVNNCDDITLDWQCECNGDTPNVAEFNQTIPFFECQVYIQQCVLATDNAYEQSQCLARQCGGPVLPIDYANDGQSSSSSVTTTSTTTSDGSGNSPTTTPTASASGDGGNAAPMITAMPKFGIGAVVGGMAVLGMAL